MERDYQALAKLMPKLRELSHDAVWERRLALVDQAIEAGEQVSVIAREMGVGRSSLYRHMNKRKASE